MAPLFKTQSLCRYYQAGSAAEVRALIDVTLDIDLGSFTVLTGPSGSGKTTLLALLGALDRPTRGQIYFQGEEMGNCSGAARTRARRRMGFVFQDFALIPHLSAVENITYPLIPRRIPRVARVRRAMDLLSRLEMERRAAAPARELSGGEQQRVAIARALAGSPEVVLADEPTSNLDQNSGRALLALLQETHATGTTIVLSCHDPAANSMASRVLELRGGTLAQC
jgi:putative ABC transport system ATP-binding protein